MNYTGAFAPIEETITLSVSSTSSYDTTSGTGDVVRLVNGGSTLCFVAFGAELATDSAGMPMPAGRVEYISVPSTATPASYSIAAVTTSGTTTLYITRGSLG